MKKFVCITGLPGAGKSVASDFFVKKGYRYVRFGQIVLDEVQNRNLEVSETNERFVREDLRKKYGMAAMAILNLPKFKELLKSDPVIGDGLYSFEEYKVLKKEFGNNFIVIAIFAPPEQRHKRLVDRKLLPEDSAKKFRPLTLKEAESRDFAEIENLNKGGTIAMADYTILNTKGLQSFKSQLKEIFKEIVKNS